MRVDLEPSIQSGLQTPVESIEGVQESIDHTLKWPDGFYATITQSLPNVTAYIGNVFEVLSETFKTLFDPFQFLINVVQQLSSISGRCHSVCFQQWT